MLKSIVSIAYLWGLFVHIWWGRPSIPTMLKNGADENLLIMRTFDFVKKQHSSTLTIEMFPLYEYHFIIFQMDCSSIILLL